MRDVRSGAVVTLHRVTPEPASTRPLVVAIAIGAIGGLAIFIIAWLSIMRPFAGTTSPPQRVPVLAAITAAASDIAPAPRPRTTPRPTPTWIWSSPQASPGEQACFRRELSSTSNDASRLIIRVAADNRATIHLDNEIIGQCDDWMMPIEISLDSLAPRTGPHILEIHAANDDDASPAAVIAIIEIHRADQPVEYLVTDATWLASAAPDFAETHNAVEIAPLGAGPWGDIAGFFGDVLDRRIEAPPGFIVELVYSVPRAQGSWVSMTVDDAGRLIASDQSGGLFRITPAPNASSARETQVEAIDSPVGGAQGLLCLGNDLYAVVAVNRAQGPGLYRLRDTDDDDSYDAWSQLRAFSDGGEHGPHAVILGPDNHLYIVAGNHTPLPDPEKSAPPRHWSEDHLLPRLWDALGHAVGILAPGGWICRTDLEGSEFEVVAIGMRNCYDIAFNRDGELFTYDADMEWDMGAPWYRPTRILHVTSGADFGWRSGTGKWPPYYPDSLPGVADVGPGSPTGICFGDGLKFPARHQRAMFACDWTFGTIYAVDLTERGASYGAKFEPFITGRPLPVADIVVNPIDGALYFVVGGRGVPSAIYRVRYVGDEFSEPVATVAGNHGAPAAARTQRHRLEQYHRDDPEPALSRIWDHLGHDDRFIAYAARIALEHQPVETWAERVFAADDPRIAIPAAIALARCGDASHRAPIIDLLRSIDWDDLDRAHRINLLRAWSLTFIRLGKPEEAAVRDLADIFEDLYPSNDDLIDRELCDLLVFLDSPTVVARTIPLMERQSSTTPQFDEALLSRNDTYGSVILKMTSAMPQQQQVHYALSLRHATKGWTPDLRERYFRWFDTARTTAGGLSFTGFLDNIHRDALAKIPESEREKYAQLGALSALPSDVPHPRGPGRAWTIDEVERIARARLDQPRNFESGQRMYAAAQCIQCHRFAGTGRAGGPDLSAVATRYTLRDLIESIIEPSRIISDQYHQTEFVLDDDSLIIGRVVDETETSVKIIQSLNTPEFTFDVPQEQIRERRQSTVSAMLPNALDPLNEDEVLDLLAYLLGEGDRRSDMFEQPDAEGFIELFDGRSLVGWEGDPRYWSVENGDIVGHSTAETPLAANTFLIWRGSQVENFELRAEVLLRGDNNSGIQYRGTVQPNFGVHGYQCDIHPQPDYLGMLYEEGGRGNVATRGEQVAIARDGTKSPLASVSDQPKANSQKPTALSSWHTYTIIARGHRIEHRIDGEVAVIVEDALGPRHGVIALQLHVGEPYEVRFRNLRLRRIE